MILVGQFDSPFVRRVAVTLNHYHMPYTRNPISVFRDVGEMQKINPLVRVPSLILETGEVLIDSSAIIDHLDEMAGPARALTPAHGPERRKVMQAIVLALGAMEKCVALFFERLFHIDKHINHRHPTFSNGVVGGFVVLGETQAGRKRSWYCGAVSGHMAHLAPQQPQAHQRRK